MPTLTAGLKRSTIVDEARSGYLLSLDVTVPLFNRGQSVAAVASAQTARADVQVSAFPERYEPNDDDEYDRLSTEGVI